MKDERSMGHVADRIRKTEDPLAMESNRTREYEKLFNSEVCEPHKNDGQHAKQECPKCDPNRLFACRELQRPVPGSPR